MFAGAAVILLLAAGEPREAPSAARAELEACAARIEAMKARREEGAELERLLRRAQELAAELERSIASVHPEAALPSSEELRERADAARDAADRLSAEIAALDVRIGDARRAALDDSVQSAAIASGPRSPVDAKLQALLAERAALAARRARVLEEAGPPCRPARALGLEVRVERRGRDRNREDRRDDRAIPQRELLLDPGRERDLPLRRDGPLGDPERPADRDVAGRLPRRLHPEREANLAGASRVVEHELGGLAGWGDEPWPREDLPFGRGDLHLDELAGRADLPIVTDPLDRAVRPDGDLGGARAHEECSGEDERDAAAGREGEHIPAQGCNRCARDDFRESGCLSLSTVPRAVAFRSHPLEKPWKPTHAPNDSFP